MQLIIGKYIFLENLLSNKPVEFRKKEQKQSRTLSKFLGKKFNYLKGTDWLKIIKIILMDDHIPLGVTFYVFRILKYIILMKK